MKRFLAVFFGMLLAAGACSARAQVAPAAASRRLVINVGGEGSAFQPDYTGAGVAVASPNKLVGPGAYVDADFTRWIQIEGEGRWLHWNEYDGVGQNTYMIGPRVPIIEFKRLTPYGKFLIGWGSGSGGWLTGRALAWTYGGGVDFQLSHKLTLRCFDFEYQDWRVTPSLHPYGGSVGLSYKVF